MCSTDAYAAVVIVPRGGRYGPVYGRSVMPGWKRKVRKTPVSTSRLYSATPGRNDQWSGNALRRNSLPAEATGDRWSSAVPHRSPRPLPRAGRRSRETATARSPSTRCRVRHSRCSLEPGTTPRTPPARNGPADGTPELITVRRRPDRLAGPHLLVFCVFGNGDPNRLTWQRPGRRRRPADPALRRGPRPAVRRVGGPGRAARRPLRPAPARRLRLGRRAGRARTGAAGIRGGRRNPAGLGGRRGRGRRRRDLPPGRPSAPLAKLVRVPG